MPILRLDKKGKHYVEGFDGGMGWGFSSVVSAVTGAAGSVWGAATSVVKSAAEIAEDTARAAASVALKAANVVEIPKILNAGTALTNFTVNNAIGVTTGLSAVAANEALDIVNTAKALPSVVSNPSSAADLIIKEALRQAALINATTAVLTKPIENVIEATPIVKEIIPTATLVVGTGAGLVSQVPIVKDVLPAVGQTMLKVPILGDFVEGTAKILTDVPIVGGLVAPLVQVVGLAPKQTQQVQDSQVIEEIQYVYEDAPVEEEQAAASEAQTQTKAKGKNYFEHPIAAYFR